MKEDKQKRIYLDYSASTPLRDEVRKELIDIMDMYANPSSIHKDGMHASAMLDSARSRIARVLGVKSTEIYFTSGATEANNLAISGRIKSLTEKGVDFSDIHCITTTIEHPSVLNIFNFLETKGVLVTYLKPNKKGIINIDDFKKALRQETKIVSIGHANSEIGSIQKIHALAKIVNEYKQENNTDIIFHIDGGQAVFAQQIAPNGLGVDMMTLDSIKVYGPRGFGILYLRKGVEISPIFFGGGQEGGLRPGTENVHSAVGFAKALELVEENKKDEIDRITELRKIFLETLEFDKKGGCTGGVLKDAKLNGQIKGGMSHVVNMSIPDIDSEYILMALDHVGIACSTKSACSETKETGISHVVASVTDDVWRSKNTLRFSFGINTTKEDVITAAELLLDIIKKYKKM